MPRVEGLSNEQGTFIRAFRRSPAGPPVQGWPRPVVLRRWMSKPAFRRALGEIRSAGELQTRVRLAAAGVAAADGLRTTAPGESSDDRRASFQQNLDLLRLEIQRERAGH